MEAIRITLFPFLQRNPKIRCICLSQPLICYLMQHCRNWRGRSGEENIYCHWQVSINQQKKLKKVAVTILAAVMMLLISTTVFAADSPVKTSFNASLTKKTVTYTGKKQQPKVVVKNEAGKTIKAKYYTVKVKTCKNAGTYKVTIIGKGKYAGYTQTLTYKIKAKTQKVTLKSTDKYTVKASAVLIYT